MEGSRLPLEGITIADFSWVIAGPRATEFLGAMGARVIKIEGPFHPDQFRGYLNEIPGKEHEQYSATFWGLNFSKENVTLDIMSPRGRELALEIVKRSDVAIENYAYGVMQKAGLTYEDLRKVNPEIIMVSGSALGKTGPAKGFVTYGALLHAFCGLNTITGYEGEEPGYGSLSLTFTDPLTSGTFVMAVLSALREKQRTGRGQLVDVSMGETTINQIPEYFLDYTVNGRIHGPQGNSDLRGAPHTSYQCKDPGSWLAITVRNQQEWKRLCAVMGNPPWSQEPRFADQFRRWKNRADLDTLMAAWALTQDANTAMHQLQKAGVPAGVCHNNGAVYNDPHLNARGMFVEMEQELVGRKPILRIPWLLNPGPNGRYSPAPMLGQDNVPILQDMLGLSEAEVEELHDKKITV